MLRLILIAVLLAGCASASLRDRLEPYRGQTIQALIPKLGYPTSQQIVLGDTVYTFAFHNPANDFACSVQVATDAAGLIKDFHGAGNNGGCEEVAQRLR